MTSSLGPSPECIALDNPTNGQIRDLFFEEVYRPGHEVIFECDDKYKLTGAPIVKCLENGNWSHPVPTCTRMFFQTISHFVLIEIVIQYVQSMCCRIVLIAI